MAPLGSGAHSSAICYPVAVVYPCRSVFLQDMYTPSYKTTRVKFPTWERVTPRLGAYLQCSMVGRERKGLIHALSRGGMQGTWVLAIACRQARPGPI